MRIVFQIVQLFARSIWAPKRCLYIVQFTVIVHIMQQSHKVRTIPVLGLHIWSVGHEIAKVTILLCAHCTNPIDCIVTSVLGSDYILARREIGGEKMLPFHLVWYFEICQGQRGGANIDPADQILTDNPRLQLVHMIQPGNNQGDFMSSFINELFVSWQTHTMVAEQKDDRIFK